jgi:hypothetical protein
MGDASTCPEARFVTYRMSVEEPDWVNGWYVASQILADLALLRAATPPPNPVPQLPRVLPGPTADRPDQEALCHVEKAFIFLDRLWDDAYGGYYPGSNVFGTEVDRADRYADDNALAGLAHIAALEPVADPALRARYQHAIRRAAAFLQESGLWDDIYGGGFWWTTSKGATVEGKTAQTNALAALFFARAFEVTGDPDYRAWAIRTLLWLDTVLFDPSLGLYRWNVGRADIADEMSAPVISDRYLSYDQGIAIQAQLAAYHLDGDAQRLTRAVQIGREIEPTFWNEGGGYNLESGVDQVYTAYAAWTSLGHLALYQETGDNQWLEVARRNTDALRAALIEPITGAVGYRFYRCVDHLAPNCEGRLGELVIDSTYDGAAQAWMQYLLTTLGAQGRGTQSP